jgi:hypothetical protein
MYHLHHQGEWDDTLNCDRPAGNKIKSRHNLKDRFWQTPTLSIYYETETYLISNVNKFDLIWFAVSYFVRFL